MKANELVENNYFLFTGNSEGLFDYQNTIGQLKLNDNFQFYVYFKNQSNELLESFKSSKISPIPLTKEILEKCGFEMEVENSGAPINEDTEIWYDKKSPVSFFFDNYGALILNEYHVSINRPKYLHQLQNLYFSLVGEELEIQL